ncbi:MAG: hypothetical protein AB1578_20000 [Thermodesulfobacteriota bacterium]
MRGEHLHTLARLWRHPAASREELAGFRDRKLRSVVARAYRTVPFYRSLLDGCGVRPEDVRGVADLSVLPMTSSQDYRTRPLEEVISGRVSARALVRRPTSGSSGRPFVIRRTEAEDHLLNQFRLRALRDFGVRLRDRIGHVRLVSASHRRGSWAGRLRQALGIHREFPVDSLWPAERLLDALTAARPDVIKGYPSVLSRAAGSLREHPQPELAPRLVVAGGETLAPLRRQRIQEGFGAPVFDIYGAHEFNLLAWECSRAGGYHVCDDNVVLEVLRDGRPARPGERGEVVVTGLHGYAMPFLRYRLGDVAIRGPEVCSCGAPFSTLRGVEGRMHDYFRMPGGGLLHPDEIVVPIMEAEAGWFDRYQLTQVREDLVVLQVQPFDAPGEERTARVRRLAAERLPTGVAFRLELVDRLEEPGPGGKFRFCRSLVASDLDGVEWGRL